MKLLCSVALWLNGRFAVPNAPDVMVVVLQCVFTLWWSGRLTTMMDGNETSNYLVSSEKIPLSLINHVPQKNPTTHACWISPIPHSLCDAIPAISSSNSAAWEPRHPFWYCTALVWFPRESECGALAGSPKRPSYPTSMSNIYTGSITIKLDVKIYSLYSPPC